MEPPSTPLTALVLEISSPPLKIDTEPPPASEAFCSWHVASKNSPTEEKPDLMAFPPELLAEQATIIGQELFKKVVPSHCLGSIWPKKNKPGNEHLAHTVHVTITHFKSVTNCVIATCLRDPNMTAQEVRARVVEHWIQVAQECQIMRKYSPLHAILCALQSTSICGLKNTWGKVYRESYQNFKELCSQDKSLSRELMNKEAPSKFVTQEINIQKSRVSSHPYHDETPVVPFLPIFFNNLVMLHLTMEDYLEGGKINLKKRNEEYKTMREILLLQMAANKKLQPQPQGAIWGLVLRHEEVQNESYILSCQLEP
ncbi:ral guanine nucleotide dissociation [Lynx pardinus]|uniref:Ral guanine nucleotide dissociation n=1 Tax=Lynx pardinus TaxID=191816 RepID=A0A485MI87_LYNPA|nr:ral guanine nucleotide dissociation [Lynx pardinus]